MQEKSNHILVGRISGIYGIKGWVKIESYTRPPENIFLYSPWYVEKDNEQQKIKLLEGKNHGKGLIAMLENINDRDVARKFIDANISIMRSQLPELESGEYYWSDLLGMRVIDQKDNVLGQLQQIMETGANDVLVIEGEKRHLIPLIWDKYVLDVNQDKGTIRVDWEEPE